MRTGRDWQHPPGGTRNLRGKPQSVRILAKLEGNNPGGSVKDRPAGG